ncbi:MAG: hypothetical protein HW416_1445 [Chloroflexi bacterium]|nr:hypothetical protein [Chloroflexota bacterium]
MDLLSDLASNMVVTVFGSSRAKRGDDEYRSAQRLGRLIGERGWTLCNGGHDGTMEAAARGAKEAGGRTIGVSFALHQPLSLNHWIDHEIVLDTLIARLDKLARLGDAYVVLTGGIGTLLECCLVWNLIQSPDFNGKPLVAVGTAWRGVVAAIRTHLPMQPWESESITLVETVDQAVECLAVHFARARAGPPNVTER